MNLPNILTLMRTALVPVFLVFLLCEGIPDRFFWALAVFAIASLTDFFDGRIARSRGLVTNFGKFLDPLADKVLVTCALVGFVALGLASPVAVIVIITRDYMVSAIRMVAASDGKVVAANWWGKVKTAMQMIVICGILLCRALVAGGGYDMLVFYSNLAVWVLAAVTALSGIVYLKQNANLINTFK